MASPFRLRTDFEPRGDQPAAIEKLIAGAEAGTPKQTLLGITGSGKTFTIANVIQRLGLPTLIMAPNKTLAAQLYAEMRELFPDNAVEYFVSYYDYYQPEAYLPGSDTFIEKDALINDAIDRMRHSATQSLLSRDDVIIVASVSCIYGIGSAESYSGLLISLEVGQHFARDELLRRLVDIQYERNDIDFHRGTFRVRGDVVEIFPVYEENRAIRVEFFGDEIDQISCVDPMRGIKLEKLDKYSLFPGSHYVTPKQQMAKAIKAIRQELEDRIIYFDEAVRFVEKQRITQRTLYDLEMLEQTGFVQGIENYSRIMSGRAPGEAPPTLIDYFPDDFLLVMDESHQTVAQVGAMYRGDRARKENLVNFGFRLPSALDNRPLQFEEFEKFMKRTIFVSATPGAYELENSPAPIEQLIRPTGLLDPVIEIRPVGSQVDDLLEQIIKRVSEGDRVLVTTLTKRMAEDLTEYYTERDIRVRYLHSDIDTMERVELLRGLRAGDYDVLVGINLLREGLDLPEVSLVAILDADKEGFLRSTRSLIQTIGRAARNQRGLVIMYADRITAAMKFSIDETERRRALQIAYNEKHGITPATIRSSIKDMSSANGSGDYYAVSKKPRAENKKVDPRKKTGMAKGPEPTARIDETAENKDYLEGDKAELLENFRAEMLEAAELLDFERAARIRDRIRSLQAGTLDLSELKSSEIPSKTEQKKTVKKTSKVASSTPKAASAKTAPKAKSRTATTTIKAAKTATLSEVKTTTRTKASTEKAAKPTKATASKEKKKVSAKPS